MELRYLRHRTYRMFLKLVSPRARKERMHKFSQMMNLQDVTSVLDLGGQPEIWSFVSRPLHITILNLPGSSRKAENSHHTFVYVEGDACDVQGINDLTFDVVFSNSVIEHVGSKLKQQEFAHEVRRLGVSFWVQTPSIWFPIEAHTGMPFWWFYPSALREYFYRGWKRKLPAWTESMQETRVLSKKRMQELFPDAHILVERYFGIPKSYIAWYCKQTVPE